MAARYSISKIEVHKKSKQRDAFLEKYFFFGA